MEELHTSMYRALFSGLGDGYSSYLTADEYDDLHFSMASEFQGIGITFTSDGESLIIISTMDGSPAEEAGLLSGDIILMVDDVAYTGAQMHDAGVHMRGPAGTEVKLTILREDEIKEFEIIRGNIVRHSVRMEMLDDDLAFIRISTFDSNTAEQFQTELRALEVQGVRGMVIDLRNNGGGIVSEGVRIANMLIPAATIVYLEDNAGNRTPTFSDGIYTNIPFVILVNGATASTSEILAAAVQDNNIAQLVGTQTFGKGIVQTLMPLMDGSGGAIRLTTSRYLTPNGHVIHDIGLEPDYIVMLEAGSAVDLQLERAIEILNERTQ